MALDPKMKSTPDISLEELEVSMTSKEGENL
jgi:hypothetical protein